MEMQSGNALVTIARAQYLNNIRKALYSTETREEKLVAAFGAESKIPDQTFKVGTESFNLKNVSIHKAGCFSAYSYGTPPNLGTAMVIIIVAKDSSNKKYPLALTFNIEKNLIGPLDKAIQQMGAADLSNVGENDLLSYLNNANFGRQSICTGSGARSTDEFLKQLAKD